MKEITEIMEPQIPETLSDSTRVWMYLSNRPFSDAELTALNQQLKTFAHHWTAHNLRLEAFGGVFERQCIVLMVDESNAGASGCSIDRSMRFLRNIEQQYEIQLFDRWLFGYQAHGEVLTVSKTEFSRLYRASLINDDTLVLDTLVSQLSDFKTSRWKKLSKSWHKRLL
jgi:hypothetical protein